LEKLLLRSGQFVSLNDASVFIKSQCKGLLKRLCKKLVQKEERRYLKDIGEKASTERPGV